MKRSIRYAIFPVVVVLGMLFLPNALLKSFAETFTFNWTANHANDNVDLYSIYWTRTSLDYSILDGANGGKVEVPGEDAGLINYPPDIASLVSPQIVDYVEWVIPAVSPDDIVCFVVTAIDNEGFESDHSNQLCYGPVVADFIINGDNYTSFITSGWVDPNASVNIYLGDEYDSGIYQIDGAADESGVWTATGGIDFSVLPEGTICLYAVLNRGTIEAPVYIYSGVVCGVKDTATSKFTAGTGAAGISETSATILWSTNEATKTILEYRTADQGLPEEEQIFGQLSDNNELTDHSMVISGLRPFTTFYYRVRATDTAGNELISSEKAFKTLDGEDTTAPQVTTPVVEKVESATSATISWNVNELSDSVLEYRKEGEIYGPLFVLDTGDGYRTKPLANLEPARNYYCRVRATDKRSNGPTTSAETSFTTPAAQVVDNDPPVIDEATIDVTVEDRSATITWETDEVSNSEVQYWTAGSDVQSVSVDTYGRNHLVILVALTQSTPYNFQVISTDDAAAPNTADSSVKSFTTLVTPDTTQPEFDQLPTVNVTDTTATISWLSNEETTGSVQYGATSSTWDNYANNMDDIVLKTAHSITLTGLSQDTRYYYRVGMVDGSNNGPIASDQYDFRTEITPDERAPQFDMWPTVIGTTDSTAVIRWSTDEPSTSLVSYGNEASDTWGTYPYTLNDGNLAETHEVTLTNLTPAIDHYLMVGSTDAAGNGPTLSLVVVFTTDAAVDAERPRVTVPPTVTGITNDSATIYWETDEPANGEVRYGTRKLTWEAYPFVVINSQTGTRHTVVLNNLNGKTRYYFRVGSTDAVGNIPTNDPKETNNPFSEDVFTTLTDPDIRAPRITVDPKVTAVDDDSVTITWETDEPSNSKVKYSPGLAKKTDLTLSVSESGMAPAQISKYADPTLSVSESAMTTEQSSTWAELTLSVSEGEMTTQHSVTLTGLSTIDAAAINDNTTFYYMVGSKDAKGNGPTKNANDSNPSTLYSFTLGKPDKTAPAISDVKMLHKTDKTLLITWTTDEPANCLVQYSKTSPDADPINWGDYDDAESDAGVNTSHSVTITNLAENTLYAFRVASIDAKGNGPPHKTGIQNPSDEYKYTTDTDADIQAPQIVGDVAIEVDNAKRTAVVQWETTEPGNSQVQYDVLSRGWGGYAFSENDAEMVRNHSVMLTDLAVNTTYYVRASSVDASGNNYKSSSTDENPSDEYNFYLEAAAAPEPPDDSTVEQIQADLEEVATCFIQSSGTALMTDKMALAVVGVLFGACCLWAVRMRKRR